MYSDTLAQKVGFCLSGGLSQGIREKAEACEIDPSRTSTALLSSFFSLAEAAAYSPQLTLQIPFPAQCNREKELWCRLLSPSDTGTSVRNHSFTFLVRNSCKTSAEIVLMIIFLHCKTSLVATGREAAFRFDTGDYS